MIKKQVMPQYIDKDIVKAEIENLRKHYIEREDFDIGWNMALDKILSFLDTIEVKEVDLNNSIQLTWEDMRELYIIFAEVDVDIELCKTANIQAETIGYYQEVLKRFKAQKGE